MLGNATQPVGQRLASLDILRGFDLFLLVFLQPVLVSLGACVDSSVMNAVLYQFDHEVWEGFRFWDLVMPLFLFMTGVSMPFSFSKYEREENRWFIYKKVLRRFVILFLLGMVVQGNLLGLDFKYIRLYSNTLQAIAAGYLIAALIQLNFSLKGQIGVTFLLLLAYWFPMTFWGGISRRKGILPRRWTVLSWADSVTVFIGMQTVHGVSHRTIITLGY